MNLLLQRTVLLFIIFSSVSLLPALTTPTTGAIAAGNGFTLALKSDGTVWAWGANWSGQLGNGTTTNQSGPAQVASLSGMVAVAAGASHSLALKSDGTVWAWGYNGNGQLGNGNTTNQSTPVQVSGLNGVTVVAVAGGQSHSLAADSQGRVWAWGYNGNGQLGNGNTTNQSTPVQVSGLTGVNIVAVAAGAGHSLAVDSQGRVWAWGLNNLGQLGNGNTTNQATPVLVGGFSGVTVTAVAAGYVHSLALDNQGRVWAWGYDYYGALGNGNTTNQSTPVLVGGLNGVTVVAVAGGQSHSLAADSQGRVWAWGDNANSQLGNGNTANQSTPVQVNNLNGALAVAAAGNFSLALKSDGTVWAWGDNTYGEFGDGTAGANTNQTTPLWVNDLANVTAVAAGDTEYDPSYNLALKSDGTVWAWGNNDNGQLGDGTTASHVVPTQVNGLSGLITNVVAVAAGEYHSLALDNQGNVWAWGYNGDDELGDGTTVNKSMPEKVSGLTNIIAIAAGDDHSLALKNDGTVWIFGTHYYQNGTQTTWATPTQVSDLSGIKAITAGYSFSLALDSQGNVWSWGYNADGELGNGTTTDNPTPTMIKGVSGIIAISTKEENTLALKTDGTIWQWGTQTDWSSPWEFSSPTPEQQQVGFTGAKTVVAGYDSNAIIKNDGTVWTWGANDVGQLGNGTTADSPPAVQVSNLSGTVALSSGWGANPYKLAVKSDGTLRGWGDTASGAFDLLFPVPAEAAIRLIPWADDPNQNGMSTTWPYYSQVSQNGLGDTNGDGLTDIEDYVLGANPTQANSDALVDFYDGVLPVLTSLVNNNTPGSEGLVAVKVTRASDGTPLVNAPISLVVTTGASEISATLGGLESTQVNVQTNASGIASAYVGFLTLAPDVLVATAQSGGQTQTLSINIQVPHLAGPPPALLPDLPHSAPNPDPGSQNGWDVFTPPVSSAPAAAGTPTIAEWTRTGVSDDSLILTGDVFSNLAGAGQGEDTEFLVYGQTTSNNSIQSPTAIQRLDGLKAAITLPTGLPAWSTYFVWPRNSAGYGAPVAVNRTDAWWLAGTYGKITTVQNPGQNQVIQSMLDQASPGDMVSVYGRNLSHNNGTTQSWIYIQQANSTTAGQWVAPTSVNPYRVQFTVPSTLPVGAYQVWIHNGHGGCYGWSGPLSLNVAAPFTWDSDVNGVFNPNSPATFNVKNSYTDWNGVAQPGAKGDGVTDDTDSINAAFDQAVLYLQKHNGHPTLYFPAGTYMMRFGIAMYSDFRLKGDGMNLTVLKCNTNWNKENWTSPNEFPNDPGAGFLGLILGNSGTGLQDIAVDDLTLDGNGNNVRATPLIDFSVAFVANFHVSNARIQSLDWGASCASIPQGAYVFINNCEFRGGNLFLFQGQKEFVSNCSFYSGSDVEEAIHPRGVSDLSVTNCTCQDNDLNSPAWGTFIAGNCDYSTQSNYYIANNTSVLGPPLVNNSGSAILCEAGVSWFQGNPVAATPTTVTFSSLNTMIYSALASSSTQAPFGFDYYWTATIAAGKGVGQCRLLSGFDQANTITVSPAWNVTPDASSIVMIGRGAPRWVLYDNNFKGKSYYDTTYTGLSGIQPDGGPDEWICDGNTISEMRGGMYFSGSDYTSWAGLTSGPCYFNYCVNNTISSCYEGIGVGYTEPNAGIGFLGNVFRNNNVSAINTDGVFENAPSAAVFPLDMTLFEHNTFTDLPYGVDLAGNRESMVDGWYSYAIGHYGDALGKNALMYKNSFSLGTSSPPVAPVPPPGNTVPTPDPSFGINFGTNTQVPALNGNCFGNCNGNGSPNFAAIYNLSAPAAGQASGSLAAVLELPYRVFDLTGSTTGGPRTVSLTIWNSGTALLSWTATSDSSWLTLSSASGTAGDDNSSPSTLTLSCNPAGLQPGTYTGTVTVTGASQTEKATVNFTVSR